MLGAALRSRHGHWDSPESVTVRGGDEEDSRERERGEQGGAGWNLRLGRLAGLGRFLFFFV